MSILEEENSGAGSLPWSWLSATIGELCETGLGDRLGGWRSRSASTFGRIGSAIDVVVAGCVRPRCMLSASVCGRCDVIDATEAGDVVPAFRGPLKYERRPGLSGVLGLAPVSVGG